MSAEEAPKPAVAAALKEFRRIRHGKVEAGWEPRVNEAAWRLATALDEADVEGAERAEIQRLLHGTGHEVDELDGSPPPGPTVKRADPAEVEALAVLLCSFQVGLWRDGQHIQQGTPAGWWRPQCEEVKQFYREQAEYALTSLRIRS